MKIHTGTSGFKYKPWKGPFYPEKLRDDDMLAHYASRLTTVEINNTFYRLPRKEMLEQWASEVGEDFTFAIKASRRITHMGRLKNVAEPTRTLLDTVAVLGERLGPVLFQLPPNLKKDAERLRTFLDEVRDHPGRIAFEFRHPSWFDDEITTLLHDADAALCLADFDEDDLAVPFLPTAGFGYLRLRRSDYDGAALDAWLDRVRATGWSEAWVFFKHEDAGIGPRLAEELATRCA